MRGRMTCQEATRALSRPTAADDAALADHLTACPACAARLGSELESDRLFAAWDATRPVEPSGPAWDAVWGAVCAGLDRPAAAVPESEPELEPVFALSPARGLGVRPGLAVLALAQAAAILAAFTLLAARGPSPRPGPTRPASPDLALAAPAPSPASASDPVVDIEPGEVVLIREGTRGVRAIALSGDDGRNANTLDENFALFNALEAMAD